MLCPPLPQLKYAPADLAPGLHQYDARGRLSTITVGDGTDARTTTLSYYDSGPSQGYVERVTDGLDHNVHFAYDELVVD